MDWEKDAEQAIKKVPFFVRKRVRKRVEDEAMSAGASMVTMDHVAACRDRFMNRMEDEVKGFSLENCFGADGACPNKAAPDGDLIGALEAVLKKADLKSFLKTRVNGPLKMHHEFRVVVADCPNACSRPQIADVGILGARSPKVGDEPCSLCGECVSACREGAVSLADDADEPEIEFEKCLHCGRCIDVCPTGTMEDFRRGYRIQVGGRLGRHPRLADELEGIYSFEETLAMVERILAFYKKHNRKGERLGDIIRRVGTSELTS